MKKAAFIFSAVSLFSFSVHANGGLTTKEIGGFQTHVSERGLIREGKWIGGFDAAEQAFKLFSLQGDNTIWAMESAAKHSSLSGNARSEVTAYRVNCPKRQYSKVERRTFSGYFGGGKMISSVESAVNWLTAVPGTIEDKVVSIWCQVAERRTAASER